MRYFSVYLSAGIYLLTAWISPATSQIETGILLNTEQALPSYTLYESMPMVYLVDNCGQLVHSWNTGFMSYHPKLLPSGNLLFISNRFTVREMDWDGNIVHEVQHDDLDLSIEYEVILLPNQNYLCVGRRDFSQQEFIDIGYNWTGFTTPDVTDVIVELDRETGGIVWEWTIKDHVIQERNPTTAEAAGHTGGQYGKGGDILYRWGNPQNYGRGEATDQQLYFQHNPNWITYGEHAGKLIIYDNGLNRPDVDPNDRYSTVPIIDLPVDESGNYSLVEGAPYAPQMPAVRYSQEDTGTPFYSSYTSGAEVLPNGNIFITEGVVGRLMEINPAGELVWHFRVPFASYIYRAEKYPLDYPAFAGRDLTPSGPAPNGNSTYDCMLLTRTEEPTAPAGFQVQYFGPAESVRLRNASGHGLAWILYDSQGRLLRQGEVAFDHAELSLVGLPAGLYLVALRDVETNYRATKKVVKTP